MSGNAIDRAVSVAALAALGVGGYALYRLVAAIGNPRGDRPKDESILYALANRVFSSSNSSLGTDLADATLYAPPVAGAVRFFMHPDGLRYSETVNVYSKGGRLLRSVPHKYIPDGTRPVPIVSKIDGKVYVYRVQEIA